MSLCYEFEKWTMITFALVSATLVTRLSFYIFQTTDYASAQLSGNITSKCSSAGDCVTVICINDQPCETIKSNSNNDTELHDFLGNKTKVTNFASRI
jgi:hypothetical protein